MIIYEIELKKMKAKFYVFAYSITQAYALLFDELLVVWDNNDIKENCGKDDVIRIVTDKEASKILIGSEKEENENGFGQYKPHLLLDAKNQSKSIVYYACSLYDDIKIIK